MNPTTAILASVLLPLAAAPLIALLGRRPKLREAITLGAGGATLGVVASLLSPDPRESLH